MRTIIASILLAASVAHAAPSEDTCRAIARQGETWEDAWDVNTGKLRHTDTSAVASAKQELATASEAARMARAHLKAARDAQHAQRKADAKAKRIAKLRAQLAKAEGK